MILLVPPSLGQASTARALNGSGSFDVALSGPREQVRQALASTLHEPREVLEKYFAARGDLLERAVDAHRALVDFAAPTTAAWRRFNGVVWTHLNPATLSSPQRSRLLVPSAFYGMISANDPISEYRLSFSTSLRPLGPLSTFWRHSLREIFDVAFSGRTVVDLLPGEHSLALDFAAIAKVARVKRVHFVSFDGQRSMGHDAKAAKGRVARTLIEGGWTALKDFEWLGWSARVRGDIAEVRAPKVRIAP